jgi:hypothetical protein
VWFANHLGGTGDLQVTSDDFSLMVSELYGPAGDTLLLAGGLALSAAGLLALTWAAAGVLDRYDGRIPSEAAFGAVVVVLMSCARCGRSASWRRSSALPGWHRGAPPAR